MSELTTDADELLSAESKAKDRMLATGFALGADQARCGSMVGSFENAFTTGRNEWPKTLIDAYQMLSNWKPEQGARTVQESDGVSFGIEGETEGRGRRNIRCWKCHKIGHVHDECTEPDEKDEEADMNLNDGSEDANQQLLLDAAEDGEFDDNVHFSISKARNGQSP